MKTKLLPRILLGLPLISGLPGCIPENHMELTKQVIKCVNKQPDDGKVSTITGPCSIDRRTFDTGNEKGESGKIEGICKVTLVKKTVLFNMNEINKPELYSVLDITFSGNDKLKEIIVGESEWGHIGLEGHCNYTRKGFSTEPYVSRNKDGFIGAKESVNRLILEACKNALSAVLESKMCN